MRKRIGTMLCIMGLITVFAEEKINLKICDQTNRTGITARIRITSTGQSLTTNSRGELKLPVKSYPETLEISAPRYISKNYTLQSGRTDSELITITLSAMPLFTQEIVVLNKVEPVPTEKIGKEALKWNLWGDVNDALGKSASFQATHKGGNCADPSFRGMSGDQLRVLWNGLIQPEPGCPNRMDPPTSHFQTRTLSRVEVIKGPYSVRYGLAYGGVINLTSHTGDPTPGTGWKPKGQVGYSIRENGDSQTPELLAIAGTEKLSVRVDASYTDQDSYEDGDGVEIPSRFKSRQFGTSLYGSDLSRDAHWQVEARNSKTWGIDYASLPMDAVYDVNRLFSSKYLVPVGSWFLEMKAAYSSIDHQMDNHSKPTFAKVDAVTTADTETWVVKTELSGRLGPWNVVFGADHQSNAKSGQRVKLIKMGPMAGNTVIDEVFAESQLLDTGLYAEGSRSFGTSRLTTGLRLHHNEASADRPDPELTGSTDIPDQTNTLAAMTFSYSKDFSENTTIGIASALGHRTPSITERYIYMFPVGIDAYDYIGDPELDPESMWQSEVFYQYRTNRINFNMSVFYSDIKDSINAEVVDRTPRTVGVPGVKQFINVPDAYRYGFNASMTWAMSPSFQLSCSLGETRGYDETHGEDLPQIPPLEMSHALKYTREGFTAQWRWRWVDSKDNTSERFAEIPTDSFSVHTFRAGYEHKSLGFFLEVQNVLDETYSEFLYRNIFKTDKRMTAPGRMMVLRVTKRF